MNVMGRNYGICEYSKKQIIEMCKEIDISQLYNLDAVNYLVQLRKILNSATRLLQNGY